MYESFFGLNRRPFCFAPAVDRYFPVASSDAARQALVRCIDRAEGVGLLVAAPGMGKSLVLQVLADQFRDRFPVVQLGTGQIESRRELLQSFAHDLRVPFRGMDDGELRLAVTSFLTSDDRCPQGILILADEAHTLSFSILDELRMLTNVVKDGESRVRLVLAGNMRLEEQLTDPRLESLSQRIVCRRYLERFDSSETAEYIRFQIAAAGGQVERVFEQAAQDAVFQASDGIPRLINQLCHFALLTAYSDDEQPITAAGIAAAWAELQQLPGQFMDPPGPPQLRVSNGDDDVIEYGGLSDEDSFDDDTADHQDISNEFENNDHDDETVTLRGQTNVPSLLRVRDDSDDDDLDPDNSLEDSASEFSTDEPEENSGAPGYAILDPNEEDTNEAEDDRAYDDVHAKDEVEQSELTETAPAESFSAGEIDEGKADVDKADDHQEQHTPPLATQARAEQTVDAIEEQLSDAMQQHGSRYRITPADEEVAPRDTAETTHSHQPNDAGCKLTDTATTAASQKDNPEQRADTAAQVNEFDEEEVVVDRYAQLEADSRKHRTPPQAQPVQSANTAAAKDLTETETTESVDTDPPSNAFAEAEEPRHSNIQVEEDEDRLQVLVNPYGDLYGDDDDDLDDTDEFIEGANDQVDHEPSAEDSASASPPENAAQSNSETENPTSETASLEAAPAGEAVPSRPASILSKLDVDDSDIDDAPTSSPAPQAEAQPPMALSAPARVSSTGNAEADDDQLEHIIRPFQQHADESQAEEIEAQPARPILIIEDDDEDDLDDLVDHHANTGLSNTEHAPGSGVRVEDYSTLFARLRGDQQSSE